STGAPWTSCSTWPWRGARGSRSSSRRRWPDDERTVKLLLATRNVGKLAELQRLLAEAVPGVDVVGLRDVDEYPEAPETGTTFAENALLKAREAVRYTGLPAVADDSGLTVDALNGMPGILSARWSGRHGDDAANTALLLAQMADVPDER